MCMYAIYEYKDINRDYFFEFLKKEFLEYKHPARVNMWHDDWQEYPNTLPYLLEITKRFNSDKGNFFIITDDDKIVGCSGVYKSDFNDRIAIAGVRSWLSKKYRNKNLLKKFLFPKHKEWALKNNCGQIALCFNDYNKNLIEIFKRTRLSESALRIKSRGPADLFYTGLHEVDVPVNIQYTQQWVIYEKLDSKFDFDWKILL